VLSIDGADTGLTIVGLTIVVDGDVCARAGTADAATLQIVKIAIAIDLGVSIIKLVENTDMDSMIFDRYLKSPRSRSSI
jgi:hypothetical protein